MYLFSQFRDIRTLKCVYDGFLIMVTPHDRDAARIGRILPCDSTIRLVRPFCPPLRSSLPISPLLTCSNAHSLERYYRKIFALVMYKTKAFGPLQPIFPADSKPPSKESLAFASIFARFPKLKVNKPALERRAAFERLGALQSVNSNAHFGACFPVPLLASPERQPTRTHVNVYPVRPAVLLLDKVIIYLHAGTYISGSINSHRGFVSQLSAHSHRLVYFVDYWYVLCITPNSSDYYLNFRSQGFRKVDFGNT